MVPNLDVGDLAPDFALPTDDGGVARLKDLRGRFVALFFYPKDDTSGCTLEALDFSRLAPRFAKAGAALIGVSPDSVKSHVKFKHKHALALTLGRRRNPRRPRSLRRVEREKPVWAEIHGGRADDRDRRPEGSRRPPVAQGQSSRTRRGGAGGACGGASGICQPLTLMGCNRPLMAPDPRARSVLAHVV